MLWFLKTWEFRFGFFSYNFRKGLSTLCGVVIEVCVSVQLVYSMF